MGTKRINYEDDIVIVKNPKGVTIYNGMEDYEPMKDEPWSWNSSIKGYTLSSPEGTYTKYCIS